MCIEFYVLVCFFFSLFPHLSPSCLPVCLHCCVHDGMYTPLRTHPVRVHTQSLCVQRVAEKLANNGSVSISKAIRNKELEIIPISPAVKGSTQSHGNSQPHRDKSEPKVSISTVGSGNSRLSNGVPGSGGWREESASVSIEPCGSTGTGSADDAPLNLSMKSTASPRPCESRFKECLLHCLL